MRLPIKLSRMVNLFICIRDKFGSNVGQDTEYFYWHPVAPQSVRKGTGSGTRQVFSVSCHSRRRCGYSVSSQSCASHPFCSETAFRVSSLWCVPQCPAHNCRPSTVRPSFGDPSHKRSALSATKQHWTRVRCGRLFVFELCSSRRRSIYFERCKLAAELFDILELKRRS